MFQPLSTAKCHLQVQAAESYIEQHVTLKARSTVYRLCVFQRMLLTKQLMLCCAYENKSAEEARPAQHSKCCFELSFALNATQR